MTAPPVVVGRARPKTTSTTSSAATATISTGSIDKPKKETNPRQPHNPQNAAVKLKVVVRGLPPNLPEAVFKETTKEWINETAVDWSYYVPGKLHER
jgi:regulator of nonsense transcripts 3